MPPLHKMPERLRRWDGGSDCGGGYDQATGSCCISVMCSETTPQFCHAVSRYFNASLTVYNARKAEYLLNGANFPLLPPFLQDPGDSFLLQSSAASSQHSGRWCLNSRCLQNLSH